MKAIKIIIQILIVLVPSLVHVISINILLPMKHPFVLLWFLLLLIYIVFKAGYYATNFGIWFDNKLK